MLPEDATLADLVIADAELAALYHECAARHRNLSEYLKP